MQWEALRHPNVLPLLGVRMTENEFAMISEWMPNENINMFVAVIQTPVLPLIPDDYTVPTVGWCCERFGLYA